MRSTKKGQDFSQEDWQALVHHVTEKITRNISHAEEIVQQTLLRAMLQGDDICNLDAMKSLAENIFRAECAKDTTLLGIFAFHAPAPTQREISDSVKKMEHKRVNKFLADMGEEYLMVYTLFFENGWSAEKIAKKSGTPYDQIEKRLECVRQALRQLGSSPTTPLSFWNNLDAPVTHVH